MKTRILILVPLYEEMRYFYEHMKALGALCPSSFSVHRDTFVFEYRRQTREPMGIAFHVLGDIGNLRAATRGYSAVHDFMPQTCFLVGVAGSLDVQAARLGDVAVAVEAKMFHPDKVKRLDPQVEVFSDEKLVNETRIIIDERKRVLNESFLRYRRTSVSHKRSRLSVDEYFLQTTNRSGLPALEALTPSTIRGLDPIYENPTPKAFQATMLGSDVVVDSDEFVAFLQDRNLDLGSDYYAQKGGEDAARNKWLPSPLTVVDMESIGFFSLSELIAGGDSVTRSFCVRGVSDLSRGKGQLDKDTKEGVRRVAAMNALRVALDMIEYFERTSLR